MFGGDGAIVMVVEGVMRGKKQAAKHCGLFPSPSNSPMTTYHNPLRVSTQPSYHLENHDSPTHMDPAPPQHPFVHCSKRTIEPRRPTAN
jgi:hypothetical protein